MTNHRRSIVRNLLVWVLAVAVLGVGAGGVLAEQYFVVYGAE